MKNKIFVTQPFLPPLHEYTQYLEEIWESKFLTNNGSFHQRLEKELCEHLTVDHLSLFTNGTLALVTALQALGIKGEVITTPYTFVATAHSLLWNNIKPVFVDIDPLTLNLDPNKIQEAITKNTTAILPVHVYGTPCDVEKIKEIANINNLRVIYDAAHAFNVNYKGSSLLSHGDLSIVSFHATKVFNTFEGGAIISPDAKTKTHIDNLKNFGFSDEVTVVEPGINGKMNELQAAMGVLQLKYISQCIEKRKLVDSLYRENLINVRGITLLTKCEDVVQNYSYFPIFIHEDYPLTRDELYERLGQKEIYTRRYFYPLVSNFPMYRHLESAAESNLPNANKISAQVLCLPIYPNLSIQEQTRIINLITHPNN